MEQDDKYHISFFKPTTERALYNRNMVLWLVGVWAVAIFGFHVLLRIIEKPTPEPQLIAFNQVWSNVKAGNANSEELLQFAQSALHVCGKVFIATEHRAALDQGITWSLFQLADSAQAVAIANALVEFEEAKEKALTVTDQDYIAARNILGALSQQILQVDPKGVLATILPLEITSTGISEFSEESMQIVEKCMPFYTIHNRSVLTDTRFLGFPFHYFYTAVFLLILFIGLCWVYCFRVDKFNKSIGLSE